MKEHPINEMIKTSLENIDQMIDSNKIIGEPIILPNNTLVLPISKVTYGYGVGGSQFAQKNKNVHLEIGEEIFPFGGGSGGGLSISPVSLIVIQNEQIKILDVEKKEDTLIKIIESLKDIIKK